MKTWYAVHTHVRAEEKAAFNLRRQGFEVFSPQYRRRRSHARRIEHVPAPLFPRYLFVTFDAETTPWRAIQSTFGVCYLVCNGDSPAPIPAGVVEDIMGRQDEGGYVAMYNVDTFKKGQSVQVINGALCDQVGLFECATDDERVVILLEMLGRRVKVRLPIDSVAATL